MSLERNLRVLIVDDDPDVRAVLAARLDEEGYRTMGAADGRAALAVCAQMDPAVILVDLGMPVLDGIDFIGAYRALPTSKARIVVMSARNRSAETATVLNADGYLGKPFSLDEVLVEVRRLMELPTR